MSSGKWASFKAPEAQQNSDSNQPQQSDLKRRLISGRNDLRAMQRRLRDAQHAVSSRGQRDMALMRDDIAALADSLPTHPKWQAIPVLRQRSRPDQTANPRLASLANALGGLVQSTRRLEGVLDLTLAIFHLIDKVTVDMAEQCATVHLQQCDLQLAQVQQLLQQDDTSATPMAQAN